MADESIVRDSNGDPTHIRVTSDDGSTSTLHEYDNSFAAAIVGDHKGDAVEFSEHKSDGTTVAYEYDGGFAANLTGDHRGDKK